MNITVGIQSMRISLIGAGRVATHLAKVLNQRHQIINIYSRSNLKTQILADLVDAQLSPTIEAMDSTIDLLIIAVSDQSIASVIEDLSVYFNDVLIVHTSGSTHLNILSQHHDRVGVFYPLQTFSLEREIDWSSTPLFVEASHAQDLEKLTQLANSLSKRVYRYDSAQRLSLHLAAVFACNFSNYCYDMAKQVVDANSVDFSLLYPLILETANKATQNDPKQMQTGPAIRGDRNILEMHQHMLADVGRRDLKMIYEVLSDGIKKNS